MKTATGDGADWANAYFRFKDARIRFLKRIRIVDGCWLWTGPKRGNYGVVRINGSIRNAHRAAYALFTGPVDDGVSVVHRCDRKLCCNPDHLRLEVQEKPLNATTVAEG